MTTELHGIVAEHLAAVNAFNVDGIVATFAPTPTSTTPAARSAASTPSGAGSTKEMVGDHVTMDVREVVDHYGETIVRSRYDGTYDKTNLPDELVMSGLLQRPRRQDRQPHRDPQPAVPVLTRAAPALADTTKEQTCGLRARRRTGPGQWPRSPLRRRRPGPGARRLASGP